MKLLVASLAGCLGLVSGLGAYLHNTTVNNLRNEITNGDAMAAAAISSVKVQVAAMEAAAIIPRIAMLETEGRTSRETTARDISEIKANVREINNKVDDLRLDKAKGK